MKGHSDKPLEEILPGFRQFLDGIRLKEENARAFGAIK
jgi:hypothetical protein